MICIAIFGAVDQKRISSSIHALPLTRVVTIEYHQKSVTVQSDEHIWSCSENVSMFHIIVSGSTLGLSWPLRKPQLAVEVMVVNMCHHRRAILVSVMSATVNYVHRRYRTPWPSHIAATSAQQLNDQSGRRADTGT
jgi:hypothetical protein